MAAEVVLVVLEGGGVVDFESELLLLLDPDEGWTSGTGGDMPTGETVKCVLSVILLSSLSWMWWRANTVEAIGCSRRKSTKDEEETIQ